MIKFWIKLIKLYLNRKNDYIEFQRFQAENIIKHLKKKLKLKDNSYVVDYGCGKGGYSSVLANHFQKVRAVDYYCNPASTLKTPDVEFINADLTSYLMEPADFIFCASVIEHIPKDRQALFIKNLRNNLKDNGYLYLSFPPFYSIQGGHAAYPFHYFPDKLAFFLANLLKSTRIKSYETMWGDWGLYKTSINEVEKLLKDNKFQIKTITSRFMPEWFSQIFGRTDFLNWHAEFIARKVGE